MELTRTIWEGHDYVPIVWNEWLNDPEGLLAVAEYGGRVVGLGKLTRLTRNEWWLEGLRVHPEYQGRGIGAHLMQYLYDHWQGDYGQTVRLATACYNLTIQHLNERFGFKKIGEFSEFSAPAMAFDGAFEDIGFLPILPDQASEAIQFARQSQSINFSNGFIDTGYQWSTPTPVRVIEAIAREHAWWWRKDQGMALFMKWVDDADRSMLKICLIACQLADLPAFLEDIRRLTAVLGYERVQWAASLNPDLLTIIQANGFIRDWEESVYLYEKTLAI